jgi:regulator of cell morphogenesis and NO signaling
MSARQQFGTTMPDLTEQSLGAIAVQLPGATAVFRQLKLDFCCNGNVSLRQAAQDKNLDLNALVGQLAALEHHDALPDELTAGELIDHIMTRYHDVHRAQLPELIRMAHRVETVHQNNPHVPAGLANLLEEMQQELLDHMMKEESILFPMLKTGGHPFVGQPIGMMRTEHINHGEALDRVNALTNDATPPTGACNTWRALYTGIAQFNDDLINHIHLENNILFPAFETTTAQTKSTGCGGGGGGCGCQ